MFSQPALNKCSLNVNHMICVTEKLKLHRDFSKYNYLSLDSAVVNGLDDAANFRTVRVSTVYTFCSSLSLVTLYPNFGVNPGGF